MPSVSKISSVIETGNGKLLDAKVLILFRRVASRWKGCRIRTIYFEKVVTVCIDENGAVTTPKETNAGAAVSRAGKTPDEGL
jgi:hypothetical protein